MFRVFVVLGALLVATLASAKPLPRFIPAPESRRDERTPRVVMVTNHGKVVIELYADKAPLTVANFLRYVDDGYYDGTIFHRVIAEFMIQGGGFVPGMQEKTTRDPIKNEASNRLSNERGTLAAARTSDPNSATAQFYINVKDNRFLDRVNAHDKVGYAVFGKVIDGMDVIDKIRRVPTGARAGHNDVPLDAVIVRSMRRL